MTITAKRIIVDPTIMAGKPVIKGTRIPVDTILRCIAQGMTRAEIFEDYPRLTKEDIKAALEYGADFDSKNDVMRIKFREGAYAISKEVGNGIIIDMTKDNKIMAIEILDVSEKIPKKYIKEVTIGISS